MTESFSLLPSFADRDMYIRFVGFGVGHAIQYNQSLMENQATEEDIFENDMNPDSLDGETACDTNLGADGNTREDIFEDDEETSEASDVEDELSDMDVNESEGEEWPDFQFWPSTLT